MRFLGRTRYAIKGKPIADRWSKVKNAPVKTWNIACYSKCWCVVYPHRFHGTGTGIFYLRLVDVYMICMINIGKSAIFPWILWINNFPPTNFHPPPAAPGHHSHDVARSVVPDRRILRGATGQRSPPCAWNPWVEMHLLPWKFNIPIHGNVWFVW